MMNTIEFSNQIPSDQLAEIFKDFFEQHMIAYDLLKGIQFTGISTNITSDKSSIMYSVKLLEDEDKTKLLHHLKNMTLNIYGKQYAPDIYLNGDLLCITINK